MHFTNWVSNNIFYITLIRSHSPPIISPLFDFFDAQSIWTDLEYLIAIIIKILVLILRMNKIFVLSVANCLFLNIEQKPPKLINDQPEKRGKRDRENDAANSLFLQLQIPQLSISHVVLPNILE